MDLIDLHVATPADKKKEQNGQPEKEVFMVPLLVLCDALEAKKWGGAAAAGKEASFVEQFFKGIVKAEFQINEHD